MKLLPAALVVLMLAAPLAVAAHPGGTNGDGCHTNRKTGDYHCHKARGSGGSRPLAATAPPSGGAYANCAAARAAGAAPVRRGGPGYGRHLDRDNDGVGCE